MTTYAMPLRSGTWARNLLEGFEAAGRGSDSDDWEGSRGFRGAGGCSARAGRFLVVPRFRVVRARRRTRELTRCTRVASRPRRDGRAGFRFFIGEPRAGQLYVCFPRDTAPR